MRSRSRKSPYASTRACNFFDYRNVFFFFPRRRVDVISTREAHERRNERCELRTMTSYPVNVGGKKRGQVGVLLAVNVSDPANGLHRAHRIPCLVASNAGSEKDEFLTKKSII